MKPLMTLEVPDPKVVIDGSWWFLYSTQIILSSKHVNVPTYTSRNGVDWVYLGDSMPELPAWGRGDVWAPSVCKVVTDEYRMCVTVRSKDEGSIRPVLGRSNIISQGWKYSNLPLIPSHRLRRNYGKKGNREIDPDFFYDPITKRWWLVWGGGEIKIQMMNEEVTDFEPGTRPQVILKPDPVRCKSEAYWIEAPTLTFFDGLYNLTYSAGVHYWIGDRKPTYVIKQARGMHLLGPYFRPSETDNCDVSDYLLTGSHLEGGWIAPGHHSFPIENGRVVFDEQDILWCYHHAIPGYISPRGKPIFYMFRYPMRFGEDGWLQRVKR